MYEEKNKNEGKVFMMKFTALATDSTPSITKGCIAKNTNRTIHSVNQNRKLFVELRRVPARKETIKYLLL